MKKYKVAKNFKNNAGVKKNMIFQWDKGEHCYTTKQMTWFCTPLISRGQLKELLKWGLFKEVKKEI